MKKTKLALIGCGGMGNYHAKILAEMENVEIVGVCDVIQEKAEKLGKQLGTRWCTDYHQLLDDTEAVWVCTEPFNRVDIVTTSAAAGKHIFTEKPICNQMAGAEQMVAAADKAGVKYMLGYCLRFWNPYKLMHDTFASGELGELVNCWTRRYMPTDMSNAWYGYQEKSGGVMLDFGSHDIDWLRWIGGDVKTVFSGTYRVRPSMKADEHGQVLMLFKNGGMGTCDDSWSSYLDESSIGIVGTKGAMIVDKSGKIRKKIGDDKEVIVDAEAAVNVDPSGNVGVKDESGAIKAVSKPGETIQEHFFRCIEQEIEPVTAASEGIKTLAVVLALYESARTGKSIEVR
jgi:UDP-N-acetylglucosamine 3-dehydrogenase